MCKTALKYKKLNTDDYRHFDIDDRGGLKTI